MGRKQIEEQNIIVDSIIDYHKSIIQQERIQLSLLKNYLIWLNNNNGGQQEMKVSDFDVEGLKNKKEAEEKIIENIKDDISKLNALIDDVNAKKLKKFAELDDIQAQKFAEIKHKTQEQIKELKKKYKEYDLDNPDDINEVKGVLKKYNREVEDVLRDENLSISDFAMQIKRKKDSAEEPYNEEIRGLRASIADKQEVLYIHNDEIVLIDTKLSMIKEFCGEE